MKEIKFNKTECGVEILLNVLDRQNVEKTYLYEHDFRSDFFEIVFFKQASGWLHVDQQKLVINNCSMAFLSPYQIRRWDLDADNLDFTILVFQEDFLNDFFADKLFTNKLSYFYLPVDHSSILQITATELENYTKLLSEIKLELNQPNEESTHIIRALVYYLLEKIKRKYNQVYCTNAQNEENIYAFQFIKLLNLYIKKKQRVNDYAELMHISRITLNKSIKKQFNVSAIQILKRKMLAEIKNDLMYSDLSLSDIAYNFNFSSPNHLLRFFKKQMGMTTSSFLENYQNGSSL